MADNFRAVAAPGTGASSASLVLNMPAGLKDGDVAIACVGLVGGTNRTITPPAGWTLIPGTRGNQGTTWAEALYYHLITSASGEPATYTWTFDTSVSSSSGTIWAHYNVDLVTQNDVNGTANNGNNTTPTATTLTTTTDKAMIGWVAIAVTATNVTGPGGYTSQFTLGANAGGLWTTTKTPAGSIGTPAGTCGTGIWLVCCYALRPTVASLLSVAPHVGSSITTNDTQRVDFVGTNTHWDIVNPTNDIAVTAGTLGAVIVDSATTAHANYTAPSTAQVVTVTDNLDQQTTGTLTIQAPVSPSTSTPSVPIYAGYILCGVDDAGTPRPIAVDASGKVKVTQNPSGSQVAGPALTSQHVVIYGLDSNGNAVPVRVNTAGEMQSV